MPTPASLPPGAESQALRLEIATAAQALALAGVARLIAHEINQPLAAIAANGGACLRWLARDPPDLGEAVAAARRLAADAQRAADAMRGIQERLQPQPTGRMQERVGELIATALAVVAPAAAARDVEIGVESLADLPPVEVHRGQMLYVLVTLLSQACVALEHAPKPRVLRVEARRAMQEIELRIGDDQANPVGVPPGRSFEAASALPAAGRALDLLASRAAVESHGGHLAGGGDRGQAFVLTLPCVT